MATADKFLRTCDSKLTPVAASRSNSFTARRAADPTGRLSSFYDACHDQVLHTSGINLAIKSVESRQKPQCFVKPYNTDELPHILDLLNMHPELQLSIALEMTSAKGIGALIDYSRPIDKYTRFIFYHCYSRTEYVSDDDFKSANTTTLQNIDDLATHVIVLVNWGIDAVVVLQLPPDDELKDKIDDVIGKLCISLKKDETTLKLSPDDLKYLTKILHTEVFSNISAISKINSLIDFYQDIPGFKNNSRLQQPYNYNLCSIQHFRPTAKGKQGIFNEIQLNQNEDMRRYLYYLSSEFKRLRTAINQDYRNLQRYQKDQLYEMHTPWSDLQQMYSCEIKRLWTIAADIRRGNIDANNIDQLLNDKKKEELITSISHFEYNLNAIQEKEHLIKDLIEKQFDYKNAHDYGVTRDDDKQTIERKLLEDKKCQRIICSDDKLYKNNKSQWYALYGQLLKEREDNTQLRLIYVDFSNCSYTLDHFIVLPAIEQNKTEDPPKSTTSSSSSERLKSNDTMNILLIGETGVGKSTFINAFVNYLHSEKHEEAQKNPIVLIPVSFVMTTGENFKEHVVKFGGVDTLSNEDYGHHGQSVTQHCKSYVFTLNDQSDSRQKLRIIDTPGIGDIRGLAQDDINMQHILSYINNLSHLNAVCILMKPNNSRLNVFFRTCFLQLFDFLGENARKKIIFCFTNTRSTFYAPGNTAPLLKALLDSLTGEPISFKKDNTFCFDSESFRYLVAVQNGIEVGEADELDYQKSWNKSSVEAKRFLKYIRNEMVARLDTREWKSMRQAQLKIRLMIRPMLETMRNLLRNIILWNTGSHTTSIELCPRIIKSTTAICLKCPRHILQFDDFWITTDGLHVFHNHCRTCACEPNEHYSIDFELGYKIDRVSASNYDQDMREKVDLFFQASADFGRFLFGAADTSQNDLFLVGFERMIKEERDICAKKKPCELNENLLKELEKQRKDYEVLKKQMAAKKEPTDVSDIYDIIETVSKHPMVKSQMLAVNQWQKFMIKYYEYEVPV